MANPRYRKGISSDRASDKGHPPYCGPGHKPTAMPERTASWPGLPGKTQPGSRDKAGTRKIMRVKQEGL